jgi:hypothetical protein
VYRATGHPVFEGAETQEFHIGGVDQAAVPNDRAARRWNRTVGGIMDRSARCGALGAHRHGLQRPAAGNRQRWRSNGRNQACSNDAAGTGA